jgi:prepilin-type processing-associated H-X9-DG protein
VTGSPTDWPDPRNVSKVQTPASDVLVAGEWGAGPNAGNNNTAWMFDTLYYNLPAYNSPASRLEGSPQDQSLIEMNSHNGGGNYVMADGHAKWYSTGYIGAQLALMQSNSYPNMFAEYNPAYYIQ